VFSYERENWGKKREEGKGVVMDFTHHVKAGGKKGVKQIKPRN